MLFKFGQPQGIAPTHSIKGQNAMTIDNSEKSWPFRVTFLVSIVSIFVVSYFIYHNQTHFWLWVLLFSSIIFIILHLFLIITAPKGESGGMNSTAKTVYLGLNSVIAKRTKKSATQ